MSSFKLGFIINPIAGIGGSVALKGSDGMAMHALALGAKPKANERAALALEVLQPYKEQLSIYTASGEMGEHCAQQLGFNVNVVYQTQQVQTHSDDTELAVRALIDEKVDVILFAGGDGTARNIANVVASEEHFQVPVLGIPAGCKIHSGVYAITPKAAGRVIELMVTKELVTLTTGDVMDIDESLFRDGIVKAKRYSEMQIPSELRYVQAVKSGGKESDELVLQDIAANVIEEMAEYNETQFIIGSGSTTAFLMAELGLENTLLGVDIVYQQALLCSDATETEIIESIEQHSGVTKLVITLIGGQGHIFGRGNQQLSPRVLRAIIAQEGGKNNIVIIATKTKLAELANRPLISDTGDNGLDQILSGFMPVTTGYKDQVLYQVATPQ
ncbi:ATP-NAD kinase family protein [Colwellia sp. D2M02]|uniref:ATP-NAD kinase family protein n=1 Tax=Colwellia sp. D2M02 TaxID=2841562 RepID=UPI001C0820BA|nr:ATP-NAD kinase family protein [Colwellia sp. D2M02]MBU2892371.1 ATP-NAD kinase family protein [Colwellia sp. D2M02]